MSFIIASQLTNDHITQLPNHVTRNKFPEFIWPDPDQNAVRQDL